MRHEVKIMLLGFLAACGTDKGSKNDSSPAVDLSEERPNDIPEAESGAPYSTLYVQTKKDMGTCDSKKLSHLIYVKSDKQFFTCDGTDWTVAEVGISRTYQEDGLWLDKHTGKVWEFVGVATNTPFSPSDYSIKCETYGLKAPSLAELRTATENGIYSKYLAGFDSPESTIWYADVKRTPKPHEYYADVRWGGWNTQTNAASSTTNSGRLLDLELGPNVQLLKEPTDTNTEANYRQGTGTLGLLCYE